MDHESTEKKYVCATIDQILNDHGMLKNIDDRVANAKKLLQFMIDSRATKVINYPSFTGTIIEKLEEYSSNEILRKFIEINYARIVGIPRS